MNSSVFFLICMQLQFRRTPIAADVDVEALVAQTTGFSGAEVGTCKQL